MNVQEKVERFMQNEPLFDQLMNSSDLSYLDLNQRVRYTWNGLEKAFQDSLSTWGRQELGDWKIGLVVRARNEVVLYNNFLYRFNGKLPHTISGSSPTKDSTDWVNIGLATDALLAGNNFKDVKDKDEARRNIGAINLDDLPDNLVKTDIQNNFTVRPQVNGNDVLSAEMAGLGVGQKWLNVIAYRAVGVTYTNTRGKPTSISISFTLYDTTVAQLLVDGVIVERFEVEGQLLSIHMVTMNAIVPAGSTYRLNHLRGNFAISNWAELV